jgi:hypothetical protein
VVGGRVLSAGGSGAVGASALHQQVEAGSQGKALLVGFDGAGCLAKDLG